MADRRKAREAIIDALDNHRQRATYGAVADLIGGFALGVMQGEPKTSRNSWVVAKDTGLPTHYKDHEKHPDLLQSPKVLTTKEELREWLHAVGAEVQYRP